MPPTTQDMCFKVKLYTDQNPRIETKGKIISLFSNKGINLNKITLPKENENIILAYTENSCDAEKIFEEDLIAALKTIGITPIEPTKLKISKNVFIKRVLDSIFREEEDWISTQIETNNKQLKVQNVSKMKKGYTMKIEFKSAYMADYATKNGIFIANTRIPKHDIEMEQHISIPMCYTCYSLEHCTESCPKPANYKRCSLCASFNHTYMQCPSSVRKCVNCSKDHSALSYKCELRRAIKNEILKQATTTSAKEAFPSHFPPLIPPRPNPSYLPHPPQKLPTLFSKVTAKPPHTYQSAGDRPTQDTLTLSVLSFAVACAKERDDPGCFHLMLDKLQKAHNLPRFSLKGVCAPPKSFSLIDGATANSKFMREMQADIPGEGASFVTPPQMGSLTPSNSSPSTSTNNTSTDLSTANQTTVSLDSLDTFSNEVTCTTNPDALKTNSNDVPPGSPLPVPQNPLCNSPANMLHCSDSIGDEETSELFLTPIHNGIQRKQVSTPIQNKTKPHPNIKNKSALHNLGGEIVRDSRLSGSPGGVDNQLQSKPCPKPLQRSEAEVATEKFLKIQEKYPSVDIRIIKNNANLSVDHTNWLKLANKGSIDFKSVPPLSREDCIKILNEDAMARSVAITATKTVLPNSKPAIIPKGNKSKPPVLPPGSGKTVATQGNKPSVTAAAASPGNNNLAVASTGVATRAKRRKQLNK